MINRNLFPWTLTAVSAGLAIALGFVLIPPAQAIILVQHGGYYVILAAVLAFAWALVREFRAGGWEWTRADWRMTGLAVVAATIWQFNEPHAFKVLMDELVLTGTSMSMHFGREAFTPLKTHDIDGLYLVLGGMLDKRPLLFPFLVSIVHDIAGYRPENVFAVNGVLSVVFLVLAGRLGRAIGGSDRAGYLTLLLLAGFPLVGLNATGGGFELLNLAMICTVALLAMRYLRDRRAEAQDVLVLAGVLLAQTRYESAIFVGVVAVALVVVWWRLRRPLFSWSLPLAPVLLLTIPLQNKLFALNPGYWHSSLKDQPFDPKFFSGNLGHAVNFLFTWDGALAGSPVISVVGGVCLLFTLVYLLRRWKQTACEPELLAFALTACAILANFALVLCYFWGQLDDFVASRLGMPFVLLLTLGGAFALGRWLKSRTAWILAWTVAAGWCWVWTIPFSARAEGTSTFLSHQEVCWERAVIEDKGDRVFYVMRSALPAIVARKPGMMIEMLSERAEEMKYHLELGTYDEILVFQRMLMDPATRKFRPADDCRLGPEFILETLEERQHKPMVMERLSRLVAVDLSKAEPRPEGWAPKFPPFRVMSEGGETPEAIYARDYWQHLP